jgi:hypothetical protein
MRIPRTRLGDWAMEVIDACSVSMKERQARGNAYRNLFLTGDLAGKAQTFPLVFSYIDNLSSYLYSQAELVFSIAPGRRAGPRDRALCKAGESVLADYVHTSGLPEIIDEAVPWSLAKGCAFIQLLWTERGLTPYLVQPEMLGVLHEYKQHLDREMEAFYHAYWLTPDAFSDMVRTHPKRTKLMRSVRAYYGPESGNARPEGAGGFPIIAGGLYPYRTAGAGQQPQPRNQAMWMDGPQAVLSPRLVSRLIPMKELWVWDSERNDWTTIVLAGRDCIVEGELAHRNIFAEQPNGGKIPDRDNPLAGRHPFIKFCPNKLDGYFWGRSEFCNVGQLQRALNNRVNGINWMLRMQEKPPRVFSGPGVSTNQQAYAKINKPNGYLTERAPNLKIETLQQPIPADVWTSLHELEAMFHTMAGLPPVMRGQGESGVRAQGHAETLLRTGSPRIIDRSLSIERSVEDCGELGLDLIKAKVPDVEVGWVKEADAGPFKDIKLDATLYEPPAPGLHGIEFQMAHLPERAKVRIDGHSSSPAFVREARQLVFDALKVGILTPEGAAERIHLPDSEGAVADLERKQAEQAAFYAQHPELLRRPSGRKH